MSSEVGVRSSIVWIKLGWLGLVIPVGCCAGTFGGRFGYMRCGVVGQGRGSWYRFFVFLCLPCRCWVV